MKEVTAELLAAGTTIAQLVTDTIRHPQHALDNLTKALRELGKTVGDIVQSAFIQPTRDLQKKVIQSLKDIGEGLLDVLKGVIEAGVGAIDVALAVMLEVFGVFRKLRAEEKADAKLVYKTSVPLNDVQIFEGSFVSGMSDWFRDEAVAVTTMRIIHLPDNFDTTTQGNRHTLIHELGHVWQGENTGPYYMGHALFSQVTMGDAAYNYGGAPALKANHDAGGKLDHFNPEQQAQIMADYFLLLKDGNRDDGLRPVHRGGAGGVTFVVAAPRSGPRAAPAAPARARARPRRAGGRTRAGRGALRGCRGCRGTVAGRRPAACAADGAAGTVPRRSRRDERCRPAGCPTSARVSTSSPRQRHESSAGRARRAARGARAVGASLPPARGPPGGEPPPWRRAAVPGAPLDVRADHPRTTSSRACGSGSASASTSGTAGRRAGRATTGSAPAISWKRRGEPLGALFSVTCLTANRWRVGLSFSEAVVTGGAAAAAVGAVDVVAHVDNMRWMLGLADSLRSGESRLGPALLAASTNAVSQTPYRIIGDPLALLAGTAEGARRAERVFAPAPELAA